MFLLGHSVWGYMFSRATAKRLHVDLPLHLTLLPGILPDFDIYFESLGLLHHTYTHSLILLGPLTILLSALFGRKGFAVSVGIISHLFTDALVGRIPLFYPLANQSIGLNLGIPSFSDSVLEDGMLVIALWYMRRTGDFKALLERSLSNLYLTIPLIAISSLSLLFAGDNNISLATYAFSRRALSVITIGHLVLGSVMSIGFIQGLRGLLEKS